MLQDIKMHAVYAIVIINLFCVPGVSCLRHAQNVTANGYKVRLEEALERGDNLKGKTIRSLQEDEYKVSASGAVENYTKWPLLLSSGDVGAGDISWIVPNVDAGEMEGFASRKTSGTATGTWVHYSMTVDEDIVVHFMYCAPFDHNIFSNWLAVAACSKRSSLCRNLDAYKMYHNNYSFMRRQEYHRTTPEVSICYDNLCLVGRMQTGHHPVIWIRAYPKSYYNLARSLRETAIGQKEYDAFLRSMLHT